MKKNLVILNLVFMIILIFLLIINLCKFEFKCMKTDENIMKNEIEIEKLQEYLGMFSRLGISSFEQNSISNDELITFGVFYTLWYGNYLVEYIESNEIDNIVEKYMGSKIDNHRNVDGIVTYKNGSYKVEHINLPESYSVHNKISKIEVDDNKYTIYSKVYFEYNYDKTRVLQYKNRSIVKKVENRFILLEFISYN